MKKKRILNQKGESLLESLVAILIFTMASIVLYSMITGATRINATARKKNLDIQNQLAVAEKNESAPSAGTCTMKIGKEVYRTEISIYGGEMDENGNRTLYSYRKP